MPFYCVYIKDNSMKPLQNDICARSFKSLIGSRLQSLIWKQLPADYTLKSPKFFFELGIVTSVTVMEDYLYAPTTNLRSDAIVEVHLSYENHRAANRR